jgi:hypothetical protein
VFDGIYACTPCPDSEGGMYVGACSLGLITVLGGRWLIGDDEAPACSAPYIEPGRPPCDGGKYEPAGVAEGGGGAVLYTG